MSKACNVQKLHPMFSKVIYSIIKGMIESIKTPHSAHAPIHNLD